MAVEPERYNALVIEPDTRQRMMLKQAVGEIVVYKSVLLTTSYQEAERKLNEPGQIYQVVFVSCRLDPGAMPQFIKQMKNSTGGCDAAYIMVVKTATESKSLATDMLTGVDGFLIEPYSIDQLDEITALSAKLKRERGEQRQKLAISMVVQDIITQVDKMSYIKAHQLDTRNAQKKLQGLCDIFKTFDETTIKHYYEVALDAFEEIKVPGGSLGMKEYKGASSRIKKKMEEKLLAQLAAE